MVTSYLFAPENLTNGRPMFIILGFFLCIIGWFCIFNMIKEIEKVRLVSIGDFLMEKTGTTRPLCLFRMICK